MESLRAWVVCHVGVENVFFGVGVLFDDPFVSSWWFQIILYFSPGSRQEMMQFHLHISFQMGVGKPPTRSIFRMSIAPLHHPNREKKGPSKHRRVGKGWTPILVSPESLNTSPLKILPLKIYDPTMGRIVLRPSFSGVIAVQLLGCKGLNYPECLSWTFWTLAELDEINLPSDGITWWN